VHGVDEGVVRGPHQRLAGWSELSAAAGVAWTVHPRRAGRRRAARPAPGCPNRRCPRTDQQPDDRLPRRPASLPAAGASPRAPGRPSAPGPRLGQGRTRGSAQRTS
jgi:hypothetical protein